MCICLFAIEAQPPYWLDLQTGSAVSTSVGLRQEEFSESESTADLILLDWEGEIYCIPKAAGFTYSSKVVNNV